MIRNVLAYLLIGFGLCLPMPAFAEDILGAASALPSSANVYGFVTQGYFKTDNNNFNGNSQKGSFDFSELGAGLNYKINDSIRLNGMLLSRKAGSADNGHVRVDQAIVDFTVLKTDQSKTDITIGRHKMPYGFYNDTRDVASTRPSILLPQSVYFEHSRNFMFSGDGIDFHHERWDGANFTLADLYIDKQNGVNSGQTEQFFMDFDYPGHLEASTSTHIRLLKTFNGGTTKVGAFFTRSPIKYIPGDGDFLEKGTITNDIALFSLLHEFTPQFQLSGEMLIGRVNYEKFGDFLPDQLSYPLGYYVQAVYAASDKWEVLGRYDILYKNKFDKNGEQFSATLGLPNYGQFGKDKTIGVNYHYSRDIMLSAEMHFVDGTASLPTSDNIDPFATKERWKMFAAQVTFNF